MKRRRQATSLRSQVRSSASASLRSSTDGPSVAAARGRRRQPEVLRLRVLELEHVDLAVGAAVVVDRGRAAQRVGELRAAVAELVQDPREARPGPRRSGSAARPCRSGPGCPGAAAAEGSAPRLVSWSNCPTSSPARGSSARSLALASSRSPAAGTIRSSAGTRISARSAAASSERSASSSVGASRRVARGQLALARRGDRERVAAGGDRVAELDRAPVERRRQRRRAGPTSRVSSRRRVASEREIGAAWSVSVGELAEPRAQVALAPAQAALGLADQDLRVGAGVGVEHPGELVDGDEGRASARAGSARRRAAARATASPGRC